MKTPAGKECKYFYGDYHRGKNHEECRLIDASALVPQWQPGLCATCPVPAILAANACEHLVLQAEVRRRFFVLNKQVYIEAYCTKTQKPVHEPQIGCGQCHPLPPVFAVSKE